MYFLNINCRKQTFSWNTVKHCQTLFIFLNHALLSMLQNLGSVTSIIFCLLCFYLISISFLISSVLFLFIFVSLKQQKHCHKYQHIIIFDTVNEIIERRWNPNSCSVCHLSFPKCQPRFRLTESQWPSSSTAAMTAWKLKYVFSSYLLICLLHPLYL